MYAYPSTHTQSLLEIIIGSKHYKLKTQFERDWGDQRTVCMGVWGRESENYLKEIGAWASLAGKCWDRSKAQMIGRRISMEISHEAPPEEPGKFSENPSVGSSTESYGLKVVSSMKMRGKESIGDTCIRTSAYLNTVLGFSLSLIIVRLPSLRVNGRNLSQAESNFLINRMADQSLLLCKSRCSQWTKWQMRTTWQPPCSHACVFRIKDTGITHTGSLFWYFALANRNIAWFLPTHWVSSAQKNIAWPFHECHRLSTVFAPNSRRALCVPAPLL